MVNKHSYKTITIIFKIITCILWHYPIIEKGYNQVFFYIKQMCVQDAPSGLEL